MQVFSFRNWLMFICFSSTIQIYIIRLYSNIYLNLFKSKDILSDIQLTPFFKNNAQHIILIQMNQPQQKIHSDHQNNLAQNHQDSQKGNLSTIQKKQNKENYQQNSNKHQGNQKKIKKNQKSIKKGKQNTIQPDEFQKEVDPKYPFQDLVHRYENIDRINQSHIMKWILLTQKTMWNMASQFGNSKQTIDLKIHMRQIQCEMGVSTLTQVVLIYQKQINKRLKYYNMQQCWQAKSHMYLLRAIAAVVAFQSVKFNRQRRSTNLGKYRVPLAIQDLNQNFYSTSKLANKAMKRIYLYNQYRNDKVKIFELNSQNFSFEEFGREVAKETRSAKIWIQSMKKSIERQNYLKMRQATTLQQEQNGHSELKPVDYSHKQISPLNFTSSANIQQSMCQYYYQRDPLLLAFLMNIPSDILGMIKLLFLAQNPIEKNNMQDRSSKLINLSNLPADEKLPVNIYVNSVSNATHNISQNSQCGRFYIYSDHSMECKDYDQIKFYKVVQSLLNENEQKSGLQDSIVPFLKNHGLSLILVVILTILFYTICFI